MAVVTFYEKPGCAGNARQKSALLASGHVLVVRNLPAEAWIGLKAAKPVGDSCPSEAHDCSTTHPVTPAKAGVHGAASTTDTPLESRLRGNDGDG